MSRLRGVLSDPLLSVVMPVYNERETIDEIIRRVLAVPIRTQLIVVDDCSTDGTRDILARLQVELGFTLILQARNGGKGAALRAGFGAVTGDLMVIQDADLEYSPEEFPELPAGHRLVTMPGADHGLRVGARATPDQDAVLAMAATAVGAADLDAAPPGPPPLAPGGAATAAFGALPTARTSVISSKGTLSPNRTHSSREPWLTISSASLSLIKASVVMSPSATVNTRPSVRLSKPTTYGRLSFNRRASW